jgi:DNA adenine methylase
MRPEKMRLQIIGASYYLRGKTTLTSMDYRSIIDKITPEDLVYMDPPYQGVCGNRDTRYLQSVQFCEFVEALDGLNRKGVRYLVSYDGRTGAKSFGKTLPWELNLARIEIDAGRSTQATLLGRVDVTIESLYLSPNLAHELSKEKMVYSHARGEQLCLMDCRK